MSYNMELILATGNKNKVAEMQPLLPAHIKVISLKDVGFEGEIPEDFDNLEDNSFQKAKHIWDRYQTNCLAEDTGLFVPSLSGEPGVYSARYAGPQRNDADNIDLLLHNLEMQTGRGAYFKTVMTLILNGVAHQFSGILEGQILRKPQGTAGFGYDPVFSHEEGKSLAEISKEQKSAISHRGIALRKVIAFLEHGHSQEGE
jgi:XTP/dITP diphosphohydrolase